MRNRFFLAVPCVLWMMGMLSSLVPAQSTDLFVIDAGNNRVLRYDGSTGGFLNEFISPGSGGLLTPQDLTVGPDGNLYVASWSTGSVKRYDRTTGAYLGDFVKSGSGGLSNPDQPIFGSDGNLYVSDRFSARVLRYDGKTGAFLDTFVHDSRLGGFIGFSFGPDGNLYASMFNGSPQCILRFDGKTGAFVDVFACAPDSSSAFAGLAFGSDGKLYASRYHKGEVWQLDGASGQLLGTLHCAGDTRSVYLAFGPDGRLYVGRQLDANNISRFDVSTGECLGPILTGGTINGAYGFVFVAGGPDLNMKVTPYPTPTVQGGLLTYAFKVWNRGPGKAVHEVLTTMVPPGTTFSSLKLSGTAGLGSCTTPAVGDSGPVVCNENSVMRAGSTWTIRLTVLIAAPAGTIITESATASSDNSNPRTATAHNTVH
jgi:sugar lactone lactonase YvrE